jgi:hypothetical protein
MRRDVQRTDVRVTEVEVPLNGDHVETARAEVEKLLIEHGGELTPDDVVEAARNPETKLHGLFEWDESVAAGRFRLYQARMVLQRFAVPVYKAKVHKRELLNVEQPHGRRYMARSAVLANESLREQEVDRGWNWLRRFVEEWGDANEYPEFERISRAIRRATPKTVE